MLDPDAPPRRAPRTRIATPAAPSTTSCEGTGETIIDGCRFVWGKGDILVLPSWALHEHANLSRTEAAVLFSIQDRPVLEALGLYREEALADNGGHQVVTSTFPA